MVPNAFTRALSGLWQYTTQIKFDSANLNLKEINIARQFYKRVFNKFDSNTILQ